MLFYRSCAAGSAVEHSRIAGDRGSNPGVGVEF